MTDQKVQEIFSQVHNDSAIEADQNELHTVEAENAFTDQDREKLNYVYDNVKQIQELLEKAGPLLEQATPLIESFVGKPGETPKTNPMGAIMGSLFR